MPPDEIQNLLRGFGEMKKTLEEAQFSLRKKTEQLERANENLNAEKKNVEKKVALRTAELAEQRTRTEALLASIGEGVIAIDLNGTLILINRMAAAMLGYTAEEVLGKSWYDFLSVVDEDDHIVPKDKHPIAITLTTGTTAVTTAYYVRKDKTKFPVNITVAPVMNQKIEGVIAVFHDITKEKEIDQTKMEFISLVSHQLKNPITAINGYADLILDDSKGKLRGEYNEYISNIRKSGSIMLDLVNSYLNVSRVDLGTFLIEPINLDVNNILKTVLKDFSNTIKSKKLDLKLLIDKSFPKIEADERILKIVLQNLISNAIKYIPEGGRIIITIKKEKDNFIFEVEDNGYGVPKNQQDKVFTKLFRGDNVMKKLIDGTGLGLYIVRSVLEQVGGKIWLKSEENKGSSFFVSLPLKMKRREGNRYLIQ